MPCIAKPKGKAAKTTSADGALAKHASASANLLQKACPKPQPISAVAATMTPPVTEASTKPGNTDFTSTLPVPPLCCGAHTCKATVFPDASGHLQEKKPPKKTSTVQAKVKKEKKDMIHNAEKY